VSLASDPCFSLVTECCSEDSKTTSLRRKIGCARQQNRINYAAVELLYADPALLGRQKRRVQHRNRGFAEQQGALGLI
jgi:hypothetical protein